MAKKDYGRVPMYLQERKIEMFADKLRKQAQEEAKKVPPGMRVLPEEERLETLELLKRNREEIEREISALPFVIEVRRGSMNICNCNSRICKDLYKCTETWLTSAVYMSFIPTCSQTPSMIRHKTGLETRLKEIEEAVRVFSRTNILVRAFS